MKIGWIAILLLVAGQACAQQAPWAGLPARKTGRDPDLNEVTLQLCPDTLYRYDGWHPRERARTLLYRDSVDLVGYGYRDAAGRPYGLWKYFIPAGGGYELYSEGYYTTVSAANLRVDGDIERQFPGAADEASKTSFAGRLEDPLLFTGEWRFYRQGRLYRIMELGRQVPLPYDVGEEEGGVRSLMVLVPQRRLAGDLVGSAVFSGSGYLERISGLSMAFDSSGRPVVDPLPDLDFLLQ